MWHGVRRVDVAVTAMLAALGSLLMVANVLGDDPGTRIDSHSWWVLPVFLLAVVPVLWWRRDLLALLGFSAAAMTVHDLLFGHLVRCGAGLPLAFVLAFLAGLRYERVRALGGLAQTAVLASAVLALDTAAGPELIPVALVILGVLVLIGQVARSRTALAGELRRRNEELRALRDERAALEVASDRLQVSRQLETLLDDRLGRLEGTAEAASASDPGQAREVLVAIEEDSRRALDDMREVVGVLRGGEVSLAPTPSVAQLDALLARLGRARLAVHGDPRMLPASLELSAYRIVEHLVSVLDDDREAPVAVVVRFADASLEIEVSGAVARGADLRGAVARARERAVLHAGSLDLKVARGQASVRARLPVPIG